MKSPIWRPGSDRIQKANLTAFIRAVNGRFGVELHDYATLYEFSVDQPVRFWSALWDFFEIRGDKGSQALVRPDSIIDARWFPESRFNFAENHLRRRDDAPAIIAYAEDQPPRIISWAKLYEQVSSIRSALSDAGVSAGDRVGAYLPNVPEAVIAMLATASLGAIWSACSPDYGTDSVIDRFSLIEPKVLFVADGYRYNGKEVDLTDRNEAIRKRLSSLVQTISVPFLKGDSTSCVPAGSILWDAVVARYPGRDMIFEKFPFDHPLYILFSSGTTGRPKAILHGAGASFLQSIKELVMHYDLQKGSPILFQTTTGWVVWNIMIAALAWESPIVLYDGSPSYPTLNRFFDMIDDTHASVVRMVPPLIQMFAKAGLQPKRTHSLASLHCILSGSAPLLPHHYSYVYEQIKPDVHLASPAGGTDIMATLVSGNPIGPVYPGEIQARSLGMMVEIYDHAGNSVVDEPGELVCTRPFPSVPLGFWGLAGRQPVIDQYLSTYSDVWRHGDWAKLTPEGGAIIYGRSDATLNVNGIRIGTAEIYKGLEKVPEVKEAVAIAQRIPAGERIVMFAVLEAEVDLSPKLTARIKDAIRETATARHVPARIVQVPDLLRSHNGKPSELAIRKIINGEPLVSDLGLANPHLIAAFRDTLPLLA